MRTTHTFVTLPLSEAAYREIEAALREAAPKPVDYLSVREQSLVDSFAAAMARELTSKHRKGDFAEWSPNGDVLQSEIRHHLAKLSDAVTHADFLAIAELSADVANFMAKAWQIATEARPWREVLDAPKPAAEKCARCGQPKSAEVHVWHHKGGADRNAHVDGVPRHPFATCASGDGCTSNARYHEGPCAPVAQAAEPPPSPPAGPIDHDGACHPLGVFGLCHRCHPSDEACQLCEVEANDERETSPAVAQATEARPEGEGVPRCLRCGGCKRTDHPDDNDSSAQCAGFTCGCPPESQPRMDAYYYGFDATGVRAVDEILSAVATAGKMYHGTDQWTDVTEWAPVSPVEMIQQAANRAAESFRRAAPPLGAEALAEEMVTVTPNITGERAELWLAGSYRVTASADVEDVLSAARHIREDVAAFVRAFIERAAGRRG